MPAAPARRSGRRPSARVCPCGRRVTAVEEAGQRGHVSGVVRRPGLTALGRPPRSGYPPRRQRPTRRGPTPSRARPRSRGTPARRRPRRPTSVAAARHNRYGARTSRTSGCSPDRSTSPENTAEEESSTAIAGPAGHGQLARGRPAATAGPAPARSPTRPAPPAPGSARARCRSARSGPARRRRPESAT